MPSPSRWHLGGGSGGGERHPTPCAGAAARARRGVWEVSGCRCQPAARAGQEAAWLPAPRRASGARPAPALGLWFSSSGNKPRGSSAGTAGWGAPLGEAPSVPQQGDPTITTTRLVPPKGFAREGNAARTTRTPPTLGTGAPRGHHLASPDPNRWKKPPPGLTTSSPPPGTGGGGAGLALNGTNALYPHSSPPKMENQGTLGSPSAEADPQQPPAARQLPPGRGTHRAGSRSHWLPAPRAATAASPALFSKLFPWPQLTPALGLSRSLLSSFSPEKSRNSADAEGAELIYAAGSPALPYTSSGSTFRDPRSCNPSLDSAGVIIPPPFPSHWSMMSQLNVIQSRSRTGILLGAPEGDR